MKRIRWGILGTWAVVLAFLATFWGAFAYTVIHF